MLSEKIKLLRKQAMMSQEQLAEKLNVSRQAVTKWETDAGVPDIENLLALSSLFCISLDELLGSGFACTSKRDFLFESVTEYDIDRRKNYDIAAIGAKQLALAGYEGEKVRIRLASNQIPAIQSALKVKIDDGKDTIDIDVHRQESITESELKKSLFVFIDLPIRYMKDIELACQTEALSMKNLTAEHVEFSGKALRLDLREIAAHVALNCNDDLDIRCSGLRGRLDINQISATTRLALPSEMAFITKVRGVSNSIHYERNGLRCDDFSRSGEEAADYDMLVELNGMKSELTICVAADEA